jgi:hypothetical protein
MLYNEPILFRHGKGRQFTARLRLRCGFVTQKNPQKGGLYNLGSVGSHFDSPSIRG